MSNTRVDGGTLKPSQGPDFDAIRQGDMDALADALFLIWQHIGDIKIRLQRQGF